jgi:uncharacterized protein YndB with AHSA1/START domain
MSTNTVTLHRVIKTTPQKLYKAFTDPLAMAAWLPPYGFLCTVHHFDAQVGGTFHMSFHNFGTGHSHSFGGTFTDVVPNSFLRYTDKFDDPNLPGEIVNSVWIEPCMAGTQLRVTQEGIPAMIPAEMCYLGWQESLEKLIKLVEPVIPDA